MDSARILDRLAPFFSLAFHPSVIPVPAGIAILLLYGLQPVEALKWVGITAAFIILPVTATVKYLEYSRGLDTEFKEDRNRIYVLGVICVAAFLAYLHLTPSPRILVNTMYAAVIATIVAGFVNFKTKLSLHTSVVAGTAALAYFVDHSLGIALGIATLLVGWSRIYLDHHTPQQVFLGGVTASTAVAAVFLVSPL